MAVCHQTARSAEASVSSVVRKSSEEDMLQLIKLPASDVLLRSVVVRWTGKGGWSLPRGVAAVTLPTSYSYEL